MIATLLLLQHVLRFQYTDKTVVEFDVQQSWETTDYAEMTVYKERWKFTVSEMLAGGSARMSLEQMLVGMEIDDEPIKIGDSPPSISVEDRSTRGDVRRKTVPSVEPMMTLRLARVSDIFYPVAAVDAGSKWQRVQKPEEGSGLPTATWNWTLDSVKDGKATGRISFAESRIENPVQAEGKFVISLKDGWPLELSFKAVNTYQPGDEERLPTVYEFSMKRR